jgi:vacuolar iron transporter family protein
MLEHAGFNEFTKTYKQTISESRLLNIGAKKIGEIFQEDKYYKHKKTKEILRVRKEKNTDTILYSHRHIFGKDELVHSKKISGKVLEGKEKNLSKNYTEELQINKRRSIYVYHSVIINIDDVDNLGKFVGFVILDKSKLEKMNALISKLKITSKPIKQTYYDLLLIKQKPLDRLFSKLYEVFGRFAYGISSGVLTTLGVMVGLMGATASRLAVIGGILSIAIADSLSDSLGVYSLKISERGTTKKQALKSAINVFIGKLIFALSFIIPFLLFSLNSAIIISIVWGLLLIIFLNLLISIAQGENIFKTILKNTLITIAVLVVSYALGLLIKLIFN